MLFLRGNNVIQFTNVFVRSQRHTAFLIIITESERETGIGYDG